MGRKKFEIQTESDARFALKWCARKIAELKNPGKALIEMQKCSPDHPESIENFSGRWLNPEQRRRLHSAIRQARRRALQVAGPKTIQISAKAWDALEYQFQEAVRCPSLGRSPKLTPLLLKN